MSVHNILVVGGAGYIGSHMVKRLGQLGCAVTTVDSLSSGHRDAVLFGEFVHNDLADHALLSQVLVPGRFDTVMHFTYFIQVGESVQQPAIYSANNVTNTLHLLDAMRAAGVRRFIYSSTAAIFGEPLITPIDKRHPQAPTNPLRLRQADGEKGAGGLRPSLRLEASVPALFQRSGRRPRRRTG
jgi:UDP-glucose 4-epimerase